jgi:hypothetical protein
MKKKIAMRWVAALRSGKYRQGSGRLLLEDGSRCCLGVLCDLVPAGRKSLRSSPVAPLLPDSVVSEVDMNSRHGVLRVSVDTGTSLDWLNDSGEYTFDEIADIIQLCWKEL